MNQEDSHFLVIAVQELAYTMENCARGIMAAIIDAENMRERNRAQPTDGGDWDTITPSEMHEEAKKRAACLWIQNNAGNTAAMNFKDSADASH